MARLDELQGLIDEGEDAAIELLEQWFFPQELIKGGETSVGEEYVIQIRDLLVKLGASVERVAAALEWANHRGHKDGRTHQGRQILNCPLCDKQTVAKMYHTSKTKVWDPDKV